MRWIRHSPRVLCALPLVLILATGCTAAGTGSSGVNGITSVDGGCPPTRAEAPCPDHPLRAHLTLVASDSGVVVSETDSTADGAFQMPVAPGTYLLKAVNLTGAPLPTAPALPVTVAPDQFTTVTVRFDSGVR